MRALRGAGLSNAKATSIIDLAQKVDEGLVELDRVARLPDDEVVRELTLVRGIGEWTAHMFLMFQLGRLDVWPIGDLGVRVGFGRLYGIDPAADAEGARRLRRTLPSLSLAGRVVVLARRGHRGAGLTAESSARAPRRCTGRYVR